MPFHVDFKPNVRIGLYKGMMLVPRTATKVPKRHPLGSHWDPLQRCLTTQPKCLISLRQRLKKNVSKIRQNMSEEGNKVVWKLGLKGQNEKGRRESYLLNSTCRHKRFAVVFLHCRSDKVLWIFRDLLTLNMPFTWTWHQCYDAAVGRIKPSLVHSLSYISQAISCFCGLTPCGLLVFL